MDIVPFYKHRAIRTVHTANLQLLRTICQFPLLKHLSIISSAEATIHLRGSRCVSQWAGRSFVGIIPVYKFADCLGVQSYCDVGLKPMEQCPQIPLYPLVQ